MHLLKMCYLLIMQKGSRKSSYYANSSFYKSFALHPLRRHFGFPLQRWAVRLILRFEVHFP
jgi:hypothetical protein